MPDGRFLNKTISVSERLASDTVPIEAALLFTWCIPHLDVDGRITGNPRQLKSLVCPMRDEISAGCIPDLLRSLAGPDPETAMVRWYELDGVKVLWFPGFRRQQRGMKPDREARSKFPSYETVGVKDLVTEQVRTNSGLTPDQVLPKEVKESKRKLSKKQKEKTLSGPKEKGWRIVPKSWAGPTAKHRELAATLGLDADVESAKYRDHDFGRVRLDPDRTFSNWLRTAAEMKGERNGNRPPADSQASQVRRELPQSNRNGARNPARVDGHDPEAERLKRERAEDAAVMAWQDAHKQEAEELASVIAEEMKLDIRWRGTPKGIVEGVARGLYKTRVLERISTNGAAVSA